MIMGDIDILSIHTILLDLYRLIERVLWAIILCLGISSAVFLINANFEEAASQPILTTIDTVDVASIPFPAVTVIPGKLECKR